MQSEKSVRIIKDWNWNENICDFIILDESHVLRTSKTFSNAQILKELATTLNLRLRPFLNLN
jgi:hypothetical protein